MIRRLYLCFILSGCLRLSAAAQHQDALIASVQAEPAQREAKLVDYILQTFDRIDLDRFKKSEAVTREVLRENNVPNQNAFFYFMESIYQRRTGNFDEAEANLVKAIEEAGKAGDHFLLYTFFSHLAFLQTNRGNTIAAIASFRLAKKETLLIPERRPGVLVAINISDLYYRNQLYRQSLASLNQAQYLFDKRRLNEPRMQYVIWYNKAENFFRTGRADSLRNYHNRLAAAKEPFYKLPTYTKRTGYYLTLLSRQYSNAVDEIKKLKLDTSYIYSSMDEQHLAEAFYNAGQLDSAKNHLSRLVAVPGQDNHPEVKLQLYRLLARIAHDQGANQEAVANYHLALMAYDEYTHRLTQIQDVSSQIKLDEARSWYLKRESDYQRQKLWLVFVIAMAVFIAIAGMILYRAVRQKRYYEKLLNIAKKEELAFIHSHEVRRHLSNILGIVSVIKQAEDPYMEYRNAESHLLSAAESLDKAIKNVSSKLDH
ncbi:lipopolysaccharide assembly protein LapB [Mucilaginibacter sp. UR6-11]|uniref:tetratricopeptide repeat protein n=1 Tax=Mucilaginibacter sp. UR6-11 TaxID=1435644 RepID=UPI001E5ABEF9|nr:hypothetical protein [Mucilaginibacter sp. UR6-11]MCC8425488.1 hypothetical protein [Mucilaginibacter sp. UR6-11]